MKVPRLDLAMFGRVNRLWPEAPPPDVRHPVWATADVFRTLAAGASCKVDQDGSAGLHTHEFLELAVVAEGAGQQFANGTWLPIRPGDVFFLEPGAVHAFRNEGRLRVFNLLFQKSFWARQVATFAGQPWAHALLARTDTSQAPPPVRPFVLERSNRDRVIELLGQAREESARATATNSAPVEWLALYALSVLFRGVAPGAPAHVPALPAPVAVAIDFATRNLDQPLPVTVLAARAGVTPRELVRLFRESVGTGPLQFIVDLRVRTARELLADPRRSITEVAFETGFFDGPHFTRTFTRLVGLSPRAFRRSLSDRAPQGGHGRG